MSTWNDDRTERLRSMWNDGKSAKHIAAVLGRVTCNAVIGKAYRLGLRGRAIASGTQTDRPRSKPGGDVQATSVPSVVKLRPLKPYVPLESKHCADEDDDPLYQDVVSSKSSSTAVLVCSEEGCRWPIGDPSRADFHFCGKKRRTGRPYCERHDEKAHDRTLNQMGKKTKAHA